MELSDAYILVILGTDCLHGYLFLLVVVLYLVIYLYESINGFTLFIVLCG